MSSRIRERAVVFGREGNLPGILTSPPPGLGQSDGRAFLILNSGVVHRVGPSRLSVRLARAVAKLGLPVLRFDQSGIGDSRTRSDTEDLAEAAERDIDDAMDYLTTKVKADQFVFAGLCSGAMQSLQTAWRDPRVVGALLMDPPAYGTPKSILARYLRRITSARSWMNALSGRNRYSAAILQRYQFLRQKSAQPTGAGWPDRLPYWPPKGEMKVALEAIAERGTKLYIAYTGSVDTYNYPDQLRDNFPKACATGNLTWSFMPEANHTFCREESRQALVEEALMWLHDSRLDPEN